MENFKKSVVSNPVAGLVQEKYVALTTYRKDGSAKSVPVWPVDAGGGRIGLITSSQSWKAKRLSRNSRLAVQPCDSRGRVREGSVPMAGSGELVRGAAFERMNVKVAKKYGLQLKLINLLHALPGGRTGHVNDTAIIITLEHQGVG